MSDLQPSPEQYARWTSSEQFESVVDAIFAAGVAAALDALPRGADMATAVDLADTRRRNGKFASDRTRTAFGDHLADIIREVTDE